MEFLKGLGGRFLSEAFCKHKNLISSAHLCSYWYHHGCQTFPLGKLHWLFSCLSVCKYCSLFPLTCLMLKWNLGTSVSLGCARIPLKRGIIAIMQPFGVEVALNKNLIHSLEFFKCHLLFPVTPVTQKTLGLVLWHRLFILFFFPPKTSSAAHSVDSIFKLQSNCHDLPDHVWSEH